MSGQEEHHSISAQTASFDRLPSWGHPPEVAAQEAEAAAHHDANATHHTEIDGSKSFVFASKDPISVHHAKEGSKIDDDAQEEPQDHAKKHHHRAKKATADMLPEASIALDDPKPSCWSKVKTVLFFVGPAWFVAMAYLDPGNIEADLQAGSARSPDDPIMGYRLLWVILFATILGYILQTLGIRLGTASGADLAVACFRDFPRWLCIIIWLVMELCLIGADMQAVIGAGVAFRLLLGVPLYVGILITLIDGFLILLIDTFGVRKLEIVLGVLISFFGICFFVNMFVSDPDWTGLGEGLVVPNIPPGQFQFTVGLIGGIITPHNFFLQATVVQKRPIERSKPSVVRRAIFIYCIETLVVLFIALLINVAVVGSFANPNIVSPDGEDLDLYNAHVALEGALGKSATIIWGLGLLSAGICATIASTYCGQYVMEGLLNWRIRRRWIRVFVTRSISLIPVMCITLLQTGTIEMISNFVNILQAFVFPFVLVLLLKFTTSEKIMGEGLTLSMTSKILTYVIGIFLVVTNVALIIQQVGPGSIWVYFLIAVYLAAMLYLWWRPVKSRRSQSVCSTQDSKSAVAIMEATPESKLGKSESHV